MAAPLMAAPLMAAPLMAAPLMAAPRSGAHSRVLPDCAICDTFRACEAHLSTPESK